MDVRVPEPPCELRSSLRVLYVNKVDDSHLECAGEFLEVERRRVPPPLFDFAEITDGQASRRKALLGPPDKPSGPSHVLAEPAQEFGVVHVPCVAHAGV